MRTDGTAKFSREQLLIEDLLPIWDMNLIIDTVWKVNKIAKIIDMNIVDCID